MRWLTGLAFAAALIAAVHGLLQLTVPDACNRLRDDAYYEFTWAANMAAGRGPTVSDGVSTSGVQLLWSLMLVPFAALFGAASLPVLAPWLGLALHVATAAVWWRGCRDRLAGMCVALCWLGHPLLVRESQNGQETALACLLATLLWFARNAGERRFAMLAVLAVLARSDLFAWVLALSLWRHRQQLLRSLPTPLLALGVHVGGNLLLGGGPWPDSALPMAWLFHHQGEPTWARTWWFLRPVLLGGPFALASAMGFGFVCFLCLRPWWSPLLRALPALLVGVAHALGVHDLATPGWAALLLALFPAAGRRRLRCDMMLPLLGLVAIIALHWAVRWYPRDYYVAPLVVGVMAMISRYGRWRLLLLVFAVAQVADSGRVRPEPLAGQREMELAGRYLAEVLPTAERVGCFNSGLVTFHADVLAAAGARRGIVNLDGVVDAPAFAALQRGGLGAWLDAQQVRFVLDNPVQFATDRRLPHACGAWFAPDFEPARDLVEVARFDVPGIDNGRPGGDSMRLYWRRGRGVPPVPSAVARQLEVAADGARVVSWPARPGTSLRIEAPDGTRSTLVAVDVATTVIVCIPAAQLGTGRLFVDAAAAPLLILSPL